MLIVASTHQRKYVIMKEKILNSTHVKTSFSICCRVVKLITVLYVQLYNDKEAFFYRL